MLCMSPLSLMWRHNIGFLLGCEERLGEKCQGVREKKIVGAGQCRVAVTLSTS